MTTSTLDRPTGSRLQALFRRWWPTLLALAMFAAIWGTDVLTAAEILPLLPFLYVIAAVVRRRGASWIILAAGLLGYQALGLQHAVDPTVVIVAVSAAVTLTGLLRPSGRGELLLQAGGMVVFTGLAVLGLTVAPEIARYVIAAGWLGHGLWDLVHLRRGAVVSRSYAQWCGVVDIVMAVGLLMSA
jgi:hypothetical protein